MACSRLSWEYREVNHVRNHLHITLEVTLDYGDGFAVSESRVRRHIKTIPVETRYVTLKVNITDHLSAVCDPVGRPAGALDRNAPHLHTFQVML